MKFSKTARLLCILLAALTAAMMLAGCSQDNSVKSMINKRLPIDCSDAEIIKNYDSHSGFLGDGTSFYALQFPDSSQAEKIRNSKDWMPFPLTDTLKTIAWGFQDDEHDFAPMIIKDNDWDHPLIPKVTNGYYYFRDRHSYATDPTDDSMVLDESRPSYNFTLAIYDTDTDTLYYSDFDT